MGLTYAEAKACGLESHHPDHPGNAGATPPAVVGPEVKAARARPGSAKVNDKGQNKTEAAFEEWLEDARRAGRIEHHAWEPLNLHLGPRTWLKVDFAVKRVAARLALVDVKGHIEEDALVKTKIAAARFAWLAEIYIVRRVRRQWEFRHVHPRTGLGETYAGKLWL